ncbi:hypothetical protein, partial [Aeromonas veronii]|uniref:hypothetical protein n=1 Tax=Aeromonas veronii TaxID=654 RepID=UPI001C8E0126
ESSLIFNRELHFEVEFAGSSHTHLAERPAKEWAQTRPLIPGKHKDQLTDKNMRQLFSPPRHF